MMGFKRILKAGFINFRRGGLVSWAAVLVVTITLSLVTSLILLQTVLHSSLEQIKNKVDVTIYIDKGTSEDKIKELQNSLTKLPEVQVVTYTTPEDNLKNFREIHKDDYSILQSLDEINSNPLLGYLNVKAKEVSQYETISNFMQSDNPLVLGDQSIVYSVNYHQNKLVIDRLNNIISGAQKLGFLVTLLLVVIAIIITLNTIRLTIFISKEEISVMRLVGASKWGIRGPFMVEGAIYGVVATIITLAAFFPATYWFGKHMSSFLGINLYDYYISNILQISGMIILSGVLLGVASSFLAVRKYLKK